jgi:hypothetical protein
MNNNDYTLITESTSAIRIKKLYEILKDLKDIPNTQHIQDCLSDILSGNKVNIAKELISDIDFLVMVSDIKLFGDFSEDENKAETKVSLRLISKVNVDNELLVKVFNYSESLGDIPVSGMKKWQILFLQKHLKSICNEESDLRSVHLPAMFRFLGMTNLRADTTKISLSNDSNGIDITAFAHGSHVPVKLKNISEDEKLDITEKSIKSLYNSKMSSENVLAPMEQLRKFYTSNDEESKSESNNFLPKTNLYLTTYVSDFNFQEKDTTVIDITRKAVKNLNYNNNDPGIFYNNIAIQSGFFMFEDFNSSENYTITKSINDRANIIKEYLKKCKDDNNTKTNTEIDNYYSLLNSVNYSYNKALDDRDLIHKTSNILFYSFLSMSLVSLVALLALSGSGLIASSVIGFSGVVLFLSYNSSLKQRDKLTDSFFSPRAIALLPVIGVTVLLLVMGASILSAPISLPLLSGIAITSGLFSMSGIMFFSRSLLVPARANNTYIAALQSINISLNGDIADIGCQEAKDRTGSVRIMTNALLEFYAENKRLPDLSDHMYFRSISALSITVGVAGLLSLLGFAVSLLSPVGISFIAITAVGALTALADYFISDNSDVINISNKIEQIIASDFDASLAARNTEGGKGIKNLLSYLPGVIVKNLSREIKHHIKEDYGDSTKWFGEDGVKRTIAQGGNNVSSKVFPEQDLTGYQTLEMQVSDTKSSIKNGKP